VTATPTPDKQPMVQAIGGVPGVRALAPVFISYRTSDGSTLAASLAWALRATGVPVWHDITDLPPGDTTRRLQEALTSGLSGAALIVSPDICHSDVIRETEVPGILRLEPDPAFTFAIGSVIPRPGDPGRITSHVSLDYAAADALLAQPPGTLQRFKQYPLFDDIGIAVLAREIAAQRMTAVRAVGAPEVLLDIQTRLDARGTPPEVPLAVRTRPPSPGHRLPDPDIWPPFAAFLGDLPRLLSIAGAQRLHIRGGAHLTAAFALGAAVPATSTWPVTVEDQTGAIWDQASRQAPSPRIPLREESQAGQADVTAGAPVAVYVDLVPAPAPGDAFADHIVAHRGRYARTTRLEPTRRRSIPAEAASNLVTDLAQRIRACAAQAATHRVHLFLRVPFPIAVLLGRTLNTLETTLYEWDDTSTIPRYVETVTVASGRGGGPVMQRPAHGHPG
jgi:SMODS-associated and fused to various effectors sensor domain/TIR domain